MSKVIDKLMKRKAWPCELPNGAVIHVRSLTRGEARALKGIPEDFQDAYFLGCVIVEEDGTQAVQRADGESITDYSNRCDEAFAGVDGESLVAIGEAVTKASKPPSIETAVKNS